MMSWTSAIVCGDTYGDICGDVVSDAGWTRTSAVVEPVERRVSVEHLLEQVAQEHTTLLLHLEEPAEELEPNVADVREQEEDLHEAVIGASVSRHHRVVERLVRLLLHLCPLVIFLHHAHVCNGGQSHVSNHVHVHTGKHIDKNNTYIDNKYKDIDN